MELNQKRDSNMELLRLVSIFGIVLMHTVGAMELPQEGWRLSVSILISSICDIGVTCFILISGYFGIKWNGKKMFSLATMVWTYSILGVLVSYMIGESLSAEELIKSIVPIVSRKWWFITCYFWLAILSPWINQIPQKMCRKEFEKLLGVLLILFSLIPTFLYFEIMQDAGRGIAHMIMVYLVGRYIRLYHGENHKIKYLFIIAGAGILCTFLGNSTLTFLSGTYFAPFARNSSFTIIVTAVAVFLLFKEIKIKNSFVNKIAKHTLAVYILEETVRKLLFFIEINPGNYNSHWFVFGAAIGFALLVMIICIIMNVIRQFTFAKLDSCIWGILGRVLRKILNGHLAQRENVMR